MPSEGDQPQPLKWFDVMQTVTLCASCHGISDPQEPGVEVMTTVTFEPVPDDVVVCAKCGKTSE